MKKYTSFDEEIDEYHQESTWDKVVTIGAIITFAGLVWWLIIRSIFTV